MQCLLVVKETYQLVLGGGFPHADKLIRLESNICECNKVLLDAQRGKLHKEKLRAR